MNRTELEAAARFIYEAGQLKLARRAGWWHAGVRDPESVAEHSWRVAVIGYMLAKLEGANPELTAAMCVFHDIAEARTGDIPNVAGAYVSRAPEPEVVERQTTGMPEGVQEDIVRLSSTYQARESLEARLAKDADRLECLFQALEYEDRGFRKTRPWVTSNQAKLQSNAARQLAAAALETAPDDWWKSFDGNKPGDGPSTT